MRAFFFQTGQGFSSIWDDAEATYNLNPEPGLGYFSSLNTDAYRTARISFFRKVDTRFVLSAGVESDICLTRPYTTADMLPSISINLQDIVDEYEKIKDRRPQCKILLFGAPLADATDQKSAIEGTRYFSRLDNGLMLDHRNNETISENFDVIPWFLVYKTNDADIYYIVLNHYAIQESANLSGRIDDNTFVHSIDNHGNNLNETLFQPRFSKNVKIVGNQLLVTGDKFTVSNFDNWFIRLHLSNTDLFDNAKVKCTTNFPVTRNNNQFEITVDNSVGYLYLRWNTATAMDVALNKTNRFYREYVVHKI